MTKHEPRLILWTPFLSPGSLFRHVTPCDYKHTYVIDGDDVIQCKYCGTLLDVEIPLDKN